MRAVLRTDGTGCDVIQVPAGGTMTPYGCMGSPKEQYFAMKGKEVYEFAVSRGPQAIREVLELCKISADLVSWVIPHQANINIVDAIAAESGIPRERFYTNLERYGNTAGASVLIALDELRGTAQLLAGQVVVLVAFGGCLSWAASVIQF